MIRHLFAGSLRCRINRIQLISILAVQMKCIFSSSKDPEIRNAESEESNEGGDKCEETATDAGDDGTVNNDPPIDLPNEKSECASPGSTKAVE